MKYCQEEKLKKYGREAVLFGHTYWSRKHWEYKCTTLHASVQASMPGNNETAEAGNECCGCS